MNISFDNPQWWLMVAALVPLVVHLVARTRPGEYRFSSTALLQMVVNRRLRHARPRDWLLLLLRTLLCACVGGAFLLPFTTGDGEGADGRSIVIVLDNTASMGAADGQLVRMNKAVEVATSAIQSLGPTDRANLVTLAGYPDFMFERPESAHALLLRELARLKSTPSASAGVDDALSAALRQLEDASANGRGRLLLISDFQSSTMAGAVEKLSASKSVSCISVAQTSAVENTSVTAMFLTPAKPLPGQKVVLSIELQHRSGTSPRQGTMPLTVSLSSENLCLSQPCELTCDGKSMVHFELTAPDKPGDWLLSVQTDADSFPGDNIRHLVVSVVDKLDCLVVAADRSHGGFMLRALEHLPFLRTLCLPSIPGTAADFVVWISPTSADVPAIRERLQAGETVLIVPDMEQETALHLLLTGHPKTIAGELLTDGSSWQTRFCAEQDNSFELFSPAARRIWEKETAYCRVRELPELPGASVLMNYEDGVPALIRKAESRGNLLIWNMPVTARYGRQGFSPMFLPLVAEQLLHARGNGLVTEPMAGQDYLHFEVPKGISVRDLRLFNAAGEELPVTSSPGGARSEQVALPGVYYWMAGDKRLATVVVNFPEDESDLRSFTPYSAGEYLTIEEAEQVLTGASRSPLWPWLLGGGWLFFLLELFICRSPRTSQVGTSS